MKLENILQTNLDMPKKIEKKNSIFIQKICKFLEDKNIIVICSILSIFWNYQENENYIKNIYKSW